MKSSLIERKNATNQGIRMNMITASMKSSLIERKNYPRRDGKRLGKAGFNEVLSY